MMPLRNGVSMENGSILVAPPFFVLSVTCKSLPIRRKSSFFNSVSSLGLAPVRYNNAKHTLCSMLYVLSTISPISDGSTSLLISFLYKGIQIYLLLSHRFYPSCSCVADSRKGVHYLLTAYIFLSIEISYEFIWFFHYLL